MCGRYVIGRSASELVEDLEITQTSGDIDLPRFNVAPGTAVPVVRSIEDGRELVALHWGLVPWFERSRDGAYRRINARSETVAEKPAYRDSLQSKRCIIPASGFFEWTGTRKNRQPHYIVHGDRALMLFAGLWAKWRHPETKEVLESATILTTQPNQLVRELHDRMPVILDPSTVPLWLDPAITRGPGLTDLMQPAPDDALESWPVDPRVGSPGFDVPECIEPRWEGTQIGLF